MTKLELLKNRAIIEIEGADRKNFLQGLITNNVNKATADKLVYAVMLSAQGRFLYDFFIFENGDKLILDCAAARCDEIVKKLNFYKLRSQVLIKKNDELQVFHNQSSKGFRDPRHPDLGYRFYCSGPSLTTENSPPNNYDFTRISLKIPEGESDLTYDKSFILEFGFDAFNVIDYEKGCYVGQELTARTHYRGEIRKKIFHIKLEGEVLPEKNSEITCEGKSSGLILSALFHQKEIHALALLKDWQQIDYTKLELAGQKILIIS